MKKHIPIFLTALLLISGCTKKMNDIVMELDKDYSSEEPFVNESLFYVTESMEELPLEITFQMDGKDCVVEIADNNSNEVFWNETWHGKVDETKFTITLEHADKDIEYVIRMIGNDINTAKVIVAGNINERVKPLNKNK